MSIGRLFYIFSATILFVSGFIVLSPSLITADIIYPNRIDSTFISYKSLQNSLDSIPDSTYYNPSDVDVPYANLNITTHDSLVLDGWYIASKDTPAHTIVIIHDLNQSRLLFMDQIRQLYDRGLNIYLYDLRAHGSSDGIEFSPGRSSVEDAKHVITALNQIPGVNQIILFGIGLGSEIALQTALEDSSCAGIILENPIADMDKFLDRYSYAKWGNAQGLWLPVLRRKVEKLLQTKISNLNMENQIKRTDIPMLFLVGVQDTISYGSESITIFQNSISAKKELMVLRNAGHSDMALIGGEKYYNKIASFINVNFPKKKKSRFKKLALEVTE